MSDKKKNLINGTLLLTVFVLTIYSVFSGEDLSDTTDTISEVSPAYLLMGAGRVIFFIWAESVTPYYLLGTLGIKTKRRTCFLYSSVGFFFSHITPLVGGGQPVQVYYTRKNMIPVPVATAVLMMTIITYKFVLVVIGCLLTVFGQGLLNRYLYEITPVHYLGPGLNAVLCAVMLVLAFHTSLVRDMVTRVPGFLEHLRFLKKKIPGIECLLLTMKYYNDTAASLRQHKHVLLRVLFLIFCQRLALFSATYFVYRAFGFKGTVMITLVFLQSTISASADILLLPEDMGISEHLFLIIFDPVLYGDPLLPAMVLPRGIAYYVQLGFSAAVTMYVYIALVKKHRKI